MSFDLQSLKRRMDGAVEVFKKELSGLRTGRASASLLEPVVVDAYGSRMPISQVGTISAPEPRLLTVQVWDRGLVSAVEKAILSSGLGLNPASDGQLVRVPLPDLTEERRKDLTKVVKQYAEQAKIAVRNIRRDGMDELKLMEKDKIISQDEHKKFSTDVQKLTDDISKTIDTLALQKEAEIMKV